MTEPRAAAHRLEFGPDQRKLVEGYIASRVGQRVDAVEALLAERDRYGDALRTLLSPQRRLRIDQGRGVTDFIREALNG